MTIGITISETTRPAMKGEEENTIFVSWPTIRKGGKTGPTWSVSQRENPSASGWKKNTPQSA